MSSAFSVAQSGNGLTERATSPGRSSAPDRASRPNSADSVPAVRRSALAASPTPLVAAHAGHPGGPTADSALAQGLPAPAHSPLTQKLLHTRRGEILHAKPFGEQPSAQLGHDPHLVLGRSGRIAEPRQLTDSALREAPTALEPESVKSSPSALPLPRAHCSGWGELRYYADHCGLTQSAKARHITLFAACGRTDRHNRGVGISRGRIAPAARRWRSRP